MAPKLAFADGTRSAPVSPTLRDTLAMEKEKGFFPGQVTNLSPDSAAAAAAPPAASTSQAAPALTEESSLPHADVPVIAVTPSRTDLSRTGTATSHHHQHHHHRHHQPSALDDLYLSKAAKHPSYSLGGAHEYGRMPSYAPYGSYGYGMPPGARRAKQNYVQGLGRAMPTWEEMQARKAAKLRQQQHKQHHHHGHGTHGTVTPATLTRGSTPVPGMLANNQDPQLKAAVTDVYAAMQHLMLMLPEGYNTLTPSYNLTPAMSRASTYNHPNGKENGEEPLINGKDMIGKEHKELARTTTSSSGSSSCSSSDDDEEEEEKPNPLARFRHFIREPAAEFLGTCLLLMFGNGVNNQFFLSADPNVSAVQRGTYLSVSFSWGIGVMVGVYVAGGISGGHLNPAVTLALAMYRKFSWKKVIPFWIAQILGAMTGSALVHLLYFRAVDIFEGGLRTVTGPTSTANLYTTFKLPYVSIAQGFFNEFLDTAILIIVVFAIGDSNNTPPPDGVNPLVLLSLITGIGAALGSQTAYAINPARDLGPRLMLWMSGYGTSLWTVDDWYWITTPICATLTGGLAGGLIYDLLIYTGSESPLNQKWEWRWSKRAKIPKLESAGKAAGVGGEQQNEKMPAGGEREYA